MTAIRHSTVSRVTLDRAIELAVATGVAVLVVVGFVTSYETLRSLAVTDGGFAPWLAPAVPLSFDLGIIVLSLKIVAAARRGGHALVHRTLVAGLSVATVAANGASSTGTAGRLLHAIPPAMFVVCFEGLVADARREALAGRSRRISRWTTGLLAPVKTFRNWRLHALRSAAAACAHGPMVHSQPDHPGASPGSPPPSSRPPATSVRMDERMAVVLDALQRDPRLTAPALAQALRERGLVVSVRTAQRLKANAGATRH